MSWNENALPELPKESASTPALAGGGAGERAAASVLAEALRQQTATREPTALPPAAVQEAARRESVAQSLPLPPVPPEMHAGPQPAADSADPFAQRLSEHWQERRKQWAEQVAQWRRAVADDPQLGGDRLPVTVARAQLALDRFDEGKFIGRLLEQSGYGNNPEVLRFFNRIADALMEDGLVRGQANAAMPPLEERMYAGWSSSGR